MRAVDTNIIVRLIMKDDPKQFAIASALFAEGFFIPTTVLMETGWVLASRYGLPREQIADNLLTLAGTETVTVEDEDLIRWAIEAYRKNGELDDFLHVAAAKGSESLATFDKRFVSQSSGAPIAVTLAT